MIAATGFSAQQRQSIPAILALYPDPGEESEPLVEGDQSQPEKPKDLPKEDEEKETYPNKVIGDSGAGE